MTQTYPLCHGAMLSLAHSFLVVKRLYGSTIERALYADLSMSAFISRLFQKRAVSFYQSHDAFLLRNGQKGAGNWEAIGTELESFSDKNAPILSEYLSYDELILSAMCGMSSPTHFINAGSRQNRGRRDVSAHSPYPIEAVYMGLVGARFEKANVMEHALMAVTRKQNTAQFGYGKNAYQKSKKSQPKNLKLHRVDKALSESYLLHKVESAKHNTP